MSSPQLCLRWNNHHPNFVSVFRNLLDGEEFVDVTLSVDGQNIKAHKVILSACSPYFKLLFSSNPCKHPVIILSGMSFFDLKTIIEFMYYGEIIITDEKLPDILEVAETLQVRGLFDPNKKEDKASASKNKKNESSIRKNMISQEISSQEQMPGCSSMKNETKSIIAGPSVAEWLKDQSNGNEFKSEYVIQVPESIFEPDESKLEESNGIYHGHLIEDSPSPPPSPNHGPIRRRRNSRVKESENFHLALEAVRTGQLGFCKAARIYGLNNRTLWLEYKKRGYPSPRSQPIALKLKQASGC